MGPLVKQILSILLVISAAQFVAASTYYVDAQNGSDASGNGTQSSPWKSFDTAYKAASNGDIIDLTGTFDWSNSSQPINGNIFYDINKDLTIRGQGANQTIVQAGGKPDYFSGGSSTHDRGCFDFNASNSVTLKKLKVKHARQNVAIENNGSLTLDRVSVAYNSYGGIFNNSTLTIQKSTIHHNYRPTFGIGAGIVSKGSGSQLILTNSTVAHNEHDFARGGIAITNGGAATITNATIAYNDNPSGNQGPGIYMDGSGTSLKLKNTIVAKNQIDGSSLGTSQYDVYKDNGTITDNGGNAFGHVDDGGSNGFSVANTSWYDYNGANSSNGTYHEKGSSQSGSLNLASSLALNSSNNGTQTLAITNSSSITAGEGFYGTNGNVNVPDTDQRGIGREGKMDIGAYEVDMTPLTTYYVKAQNGSDVIGGGTQLHPWKSFDKAYQNASNGDTIDLTGTFDWSKSSQPINSPTGSLLFPNAAIYLIEKNLVIRGQEADQTIVQAGGKPQHFPGGSSTHSRGCFYIYSNTDVLLKKLTTRYSKDDYAIGNFGTLTLDRVSVAYNAESGIFNNGTLTIEKSTIGNNYNSSLGGGIFSSSGSIKLTNSTVAYNESDTVGAGIIIRDGAVTLTNTTVAYNNSTNGDQGPGIAIDRSGASLKLKNTIVAENQTNSTPLSTGSYDIYNYSGTVTDNGGNAFGHVDDGGSNGFNVAGSSWYDYNGANSSNGTYQEKGSSQSGSLFLSSILGINGSENGTKTLAITGTKSITYNEGLTGSNGSVSVPSEDQRGKTHISQPNIGAYELQYPQPDRNNALDFDGTDDYVGGMDINPKLNNEITVSAWVQPNSFSSSDFQGIVTEKYDPNGTDVVFELFYDGTKDKYAAGFYDGTWHKVFDANKYTRTGQWIFLAATYNGTKLKLYKNGKLVGQVSDNTGLPSGDHQWRIGSRHDKFSNAADYFNGTIDEVRIWSEARSSAEIRTNMCRILQGHENNLEAYYRFNQTSGNKAPDLSTNDQKGTLNNMSTSGGSNDWVTSNAFTTWQGDENGNWTNADNWTNGVPSSGDNVGIYNLSFDGFQKPSLSSNATMKHLAVGPSANPTVNGNITIDSALFLETTLPLNGNTLTISDNGEVFPQGGSSSKYVQGTIKKKGDDTFKFPIGDGSKYAPLKISALANSSDAFTASYSNSSHSNTSSMAPQSNNPNGNEQLNNVSTVEHWDLSRANGSSNVDVTLYWKDGAPTSSNIDSLGDLKVAHWNGSAWENLGQDATNGDTTSGSITVNNVSNFSPFTFGSTSSDGNALPVELLYFKAIAKEGHVQLNWATASETNNSHFIVQKRVDDAWKQIGKVQGHGTTTEEQQYQLEDPDVEQGNTYYYRLEQVDFDGSYEYSDVKSLRFEGIRNKGSLLVYPNPVQQVLKYRLEAPVSQEVTLQIVNAYGNQVHEAQTTESQGTSRQSISVKGLKAGQYILRLQARDQVYQKQFLKVE